MAGSKQFMRIGPKVVPHVDRFLHKVSGGKFISSGGLLPSMVLTTTGAKTGQKRTTPLATKPEGEGWYVVGSNFGREKHPAWTANLIANPDAEVSFKGKSTPVKAHLLTAEEKAEVLAAAGEVLAQLRRLRRAQRSRPARVPARPEVAHARRRHRWHRLRRRVHRAGVARGRARAAAARARPGKARDRS